MVLNAFWYFPSPFIGRGYEAKPIYRGCMGRARPIYRGSALGHALGRATQWGHMQAHIGPGPGPRDPAGTATQAHRAGPRDRGTHGPLGRAQGPRDPWRGPCRLHGQLYIGPWRDRDPHRTAMVAPDSSGQGHIWGYTSIYEATGPPIRIHKGRCEYDHGGAEPHTW